MISRREVLKRSAGAAPGATLLTPTGLAARPNSSAAASLPSRLPGVQDRKFHSPAAEDDACIFPFLVPSNQFAVTALGHLSPMAHQILHDANVPSLLALPCLEISPDAALYGRTRSFVWSERDIQLTAFHPVFMH